MGLLVVGGGGGGGGGADKAVIRGVFASNDMFKCTTFTLRKSNMMDIQGVTGGTDQNSGGCSLC